MKSYLKRGFSDLSPYTPGEQPKDAKYIKLNTNESPFPPSKKVLNCLNNTEMESLRLYSDPESEYLTAALADYYGVKKENILATNGSDEALAFIFYGFFDEENEVCFPDITYGFYPVFCRFAGLNIHEIPLKEDFTVNVEGLINSGKNVIIANPNAPTGIAITLTDIRKLLSAVPDRLVVVDEAYVDFGAFSCVPLLEEFPNLIVVQTFSKSRSLAGSRLGVVIAGAEFIADLKKVKYSFNPYNVNRLTSLCGIAALEDPGYFQNCRAEIMKVRETLIKDLLSVGFEVLPSKANFLFAKRDGFDGEKLYLELKKRGILVRHFSKERIKDFIRITIGTKEQMAVFMTAVKDIIGG